MIKRVCFFSIGFAFNRLIRMKFYEKNFPKDVKMYLFTTKKYFGKEKQHYQQKYDLKRTKVIYVDYHPLKLPFILRKFCIENKIDRVINIGNYMSGALLLIATLFTKTDYSLNILADIFNQYKLSETFKQSLTHLLNLLLLFPLVLFSKRTMFTDSITAKRAPVFFLSSKRKMIYLAAPVDTKLFKIKNKVACRRKLGLPLNKKIIIFVGRLQYQKCSDILKELIKNNPKIYFILIGRLFDEDLLKLKLKNLKLIEKKSSKELVDYYNSSDFSFCINRGGGGIGLTSEEALACGVPIIVSKIFRLKKSKALYQVSLKSKEALHAISNFFKLPVSEGKKLSKIARDYAKDNYSDETWKNKYIKSYLD